MFAAHDMAASFDYTGALWMILGAFGMLIFLGLLIVVLTAMADRAMRDSE